MSNEKTLDELERTLGDVGEFLAGGGPFYEAHFEALMKALLATFEEISNSNTISRRLALRLVEVYPAIYGLARSYGEPECDRIVEWAEDYLQVIFAKL